jgi:hypothetical protein
LGTTISESNTTARSTTLGSINFIPNHNIKVEQDFEPATLQMDHSTEKDSSRTEIYPGGIAVSQSVVKS